MPHKDAVAFGPHKHSNRARGRVAGEANSTPGGGAIAGETSGRRYVSPNGSDRSPRRTMRRKLPQALALGLVIATATGCSANDLPRLGLPSPVTTGSDQL